MKKLTVIVPKKGLFYGYLVPALTVGLLISLVLISVFVMYYQARTEKGMLIAQEVKRLAQIFERIDQECAIENFDNVLNQINFLTVKKNGFVGSQIGSMNVAYPQKWQGPYVQVNPVIQGREYQLVVTKKGYFITPGDGVELPNGKIIGKDIVLTRESDIALLMTLDNGLLYKGEPLAAHVVLKKALAIPAFTYELSEELV